MPKLFQEFRLTHHQQVDHKSQHDIAENERENDHPVFGWLKAGPGAEETKVLFHGFRRGEWVIREG